MVKNTTVSVVIPTYKRPEKLLRAVRSVENQTYKDWELIVVDDDPESDIENVIPDIDDIKYIKHRENQGAPIARNTGILNSEGKYIALLDDDDAWKPTKLEAQIDRFKDVGNEFGLVYTGRDIVHDNEVVKTYIPSQEGDIYDKLLYENIIPSETPLIRRECFSKIGLFDPEFKSSQDIDLWIRIAKEYKVAAVPKSLAISYEGHDERISSNMERKYSGQKRLVEKHWSALESNPPALSQQYRHLGLFATLSGRNLEGASYLLSSLQNNPQDYQTMLYLLLSIAPNPLRTHLFKLRAKISNSI
ncbi:glycosyltransferase [Haloterrigena sp. SYSU A558-1]|uniref:Glycosyltransferase n=1 Tax=Haloterrigena gelatinilytica TaxID=2741724 RepID=A0ABX2LBJ4_9EURY|nr:glycosyltransferase family 2 protein [Haloterrigena gelatinilytica]NUC72763.1 glycosyltransferase [Haloterrigena gelatinilytica]